MKKKASDFCSNTSIDEYCNKYHSNMSFQSFQVLRETIKCITTCYPPMNEIEKVFKEHLPEIYFDKDNLIKIRKTSLFLLHFADKTIGRYNYKKYPELFEKLSEQYNLSVNEYKKLNSVFEKSLVDYNIHLFIYDILERFIEVNKMRTYKLNRILNEFK